MVIRNKSRMNNKYLNWIINNLIHCLFFNGNITSNLQFPNLIYIGFSTLHLISNY